MKAEREAYEVVNIKLTLNREEALWLKAQVQNPLHGQHPSDEDRADSVMRRKLWDALDAVVHTP